MADDKDKQDDAQLKNAISAIKAQLTAATNPAEFARLGGEVAGLLSSTNNPELTEQIKNLQAAVTAKEENAQQRVSSGINSQNNEAEILRQVDPQELAEQQKLEDLHNEHKRLGEKYEEFLKNSDKYIEERKKENELLKGINADLDAGKEIDPERLKELIKTPEQIKAQLAERQELYKYHAETNKHHDTVIAQDKKNREKLAKLEREREEKLKAIKIPEQPTPIEKSGLKVVDNNIDQQKKVIADFQPTVKEAAERKAGADKSIADVKKEYKNIENETIGLKERIAKLKEKNPQQHEILSNTVNLLEAQQEAINTGIVKDTEQNNTLSKDDIKFPPKTDEIKLPIPPPFEEIPIAAQQKLSPEKITKQTVLEKLKHTVGDIVIGLKEKFGFQPVPDNEAATAKKQLRIGLENQKSTPVNSKGPESAKQLAKNNQKNKNEGRTR
ncbi:hypothetical protein [Rickettsia endosymbiont of Halotydeus destructor]|uniref:hypothetical protein n=1 Tax=Rickettsia endosymbiont of Halotydeus destructor TaxID=2996754 RepID=UPI003BB13E95